MTILHTYTLSCFIFYQPDSPFTQTELQTSSVTTKSVILNTEMVKSDDTEVTTRSSMDKPVDPGSDTNSVYPSKGGSLDSTMLANIIGGAIGGAVVIIIFIVVIVVITRRNKQDTGVFENFI